MVDKINPESKVINPKLVLEGARMAEPGFAWCIEKGVVRGMHLGDLRFDPLTNDADAWKLCEALEGMGWVFSCMGATYATPAGAKRFWNCNLGGRATNGHRSKKIAILAALSNSTGIKMYGDAG